MPLNACHIPAGFIKAIHQGFLNETDYTELQQKLQPELLSRFFKIDSEEKIKSPDKKINFLFTELFSDINATLRLITTPEILTKNNPSLLGKTKVNRIKERELPVFFLRHNDREAIESLLLSRVQNIHPGVIVGIYLNGVPDPDCPDPLTDSGYVLLDINAHFLIKDNHIVASDFDYIKCLLESDDRFYSDEDWQPRTVNILGEPFLIELPPCWYNMWKMAFDTGLYDDSDLAYFESQKELTAFRLANESTTIEFSLNFRIDPRFLLGDWSIAEEIADETTCEKRKILYFDMSKHVDIRSIRTETTSAENRTRIQKLRIRDRHHSSAKSHGQPFPVPGSSEKRSQTTSYPLTLGKLTINDNNWLTVAFGKSSKLRLGGQKAAVLKALFNLNATSLETAQPLINILKEAGLNGKEMSLKKPFSSKSTLKETYVKLYDSCVKFTGAEGCDNKCKGRGVRDGKYYLVMPTPDCGGTQ